jgi:hypothetical protein
VVHLTSAERFSVISRWFHNSISFAGQTLPAPDFTAIPLSQEALRWRRGPTYQAVAAAIRRQTTLVQSGAVNKEKFPACLRLPDPIASVWYGVESNLKDRGNGLSRGLGNDLAENSPCPLEPAGI